MGTGSHRTFVEAVENIDVDATGRITKEDGNTKMRGKPLDRTPSPDGWSYTR